MKVFLAVEQYISNVRQDHENAVFLKIQLSALKICVKTNKCTNCSFNLLIILGSSYMFRHYIAILRELS
jgi:hypothetical protein